MEVTLPESPYWNANPEEGRPIQYGEAYPANIPSQTLVQTFQNTVLQRTDKPAYRYFKGDREKTVTWLKYYQDARRFAKACIAQGAQPHRGVAIQGSNDYKWVVANVGAIYARCITTGVYPTNQPADSRYVADLAKSEIIVLENEDQIAKYFEEGKSMATHAKCYVVWERFNDIWKNVDRPVYTWKEFMKLSDNVTDDELDRRASQIFPGECCALIPTSGTTGRPKGVMLSHDNLTYMAQVVSQVLGINSEDRFLSYLPLSHVAGQMLDCYGPMLAGSTVTIAGKDALRGKLAEYLKQVRPTLFFGVPRVYEKIQEAMQSKSQGASWWKRILFSWAQRQALGAVENMANNQKPPCFFGLAKRLVLDAIPPMMGLDQCRLVATGAAPISQETMNFWGGLNFDLLNMYGMSESSGVQTFNLPGQNRLGTAGTALPGTEVKLLDPDERGKREIACRGRHVFLGYINNPEATAETFTADGFLKTGDYGEMDDQGYLSITGRKKELLVTAGGENVAPVPIEDRFKEALPFVSQAVVIGDRRKFLSVALTFKCEMDEKGQPTQTLAKEARQVLVRLGSYATTVEDAAKDPLILAHIEASLDGVNADAVSNAAKVRQFVVLPEDLSVVGGTLTPTMKVRRPKVLEKYGELIEQLYE